MPDTLHRSRTRARCVALALCVLAGVTAAVLPSAALGAPAVKEYAAAGAPNGITRGPDGAMWFTERNGNKIGRISSNGTVTEYPTSGPGLTAGADPSGIVTGPDGNIYFGEFGTGAIGELDPSTGQLVGEYPTPGAGPDGLAVGADGGIWFAEQGTENGVGRLDPVTHAMSQYDVHTGTHTAYAPTDLVKGPDGALWITLLGTGQIARLDTTAASPDTAAGVTIYNLPTLGSGTEAEGIALGSDGMLYVAEYGAGKFARVDPSSVSPGTSDGITEFGAGGKPLWLSAAGDGGVWATDNVDHKLLRFDIGTHGVTTFASGQGVTGDPTTDAEDGAGNLWFTEFSANKVGVVATAPPTAQAPVNLVAPAISGIPAVGQAVTCSTGMWSNVPTAYAFQWQLDGQPLPGQTVQQHTIAAGEAGHQLTCRVTASNNGGSAGATSAAVVPAASTSSAAPTVRGTLLTGSPRAGQPLAISVAGSSPGAGAIVRWRYTLSGLAGNNTVSCGPSNPVVSIVLSAAVNTTVLVTATNSAGLSSTQPLALSVAGRAADAQTAAGSTHPALVSAMCSATQPGISHGKHLNFSGCKTIAREEVQAGLIDATGCFAEVTDPSQLPKPEGILLAKHKNGYLDGLSTLLRHGARTAALTTPDVDTYFVAQGTIRINGLTASALKGSAFVIAVGGKATTFANNNAAYVVSLAGAISLTAVRGAPLPIKLGVIDLDVTNNGQSSATVVDTAKKDQSAPNFNIGDALKALPEIPWLKLSGNLTVEWARCDEGALQQSFDATNTGEDAPRTTGIALDNCKTANHNLPNGINPGVTLINGYMALPDLFDLGNFGAGIGFFADNTNGLVLTGVFAVYTGTVPLGPVELTGVKLIYEPPPVDTLSAQVKGKLVAGADGELIGELAFVHGRPHLHLGYHGTNGIPLLPQNLVSLTSGDLYYPDPNGHDLGGDLHLALGGYADSTGCPLVGLHGVMSVDLNPFSITGTSQQEFLCTEFGSNNGFSIDSSSVSLWGGFKYRIGNVWDWDVNMRGTAAIYSGKPHFQIDGTGSATLSYGDVKSSNSGEVVVSDTGMGVCLDAGLFGAHVGIGATYNPEALVTLAIPPPIGPAAFLTYLVAAGKIDVQKDTCNIDRYRSIHTAADVRDHNGHAAQAGLSFNVPSGERIAVVSLLGSSGPPAVTLNGPHGRVITVPATGILSTSTEYAFRDQLTRTTLIMIAGANAGHWTITPAPNSPAITSAQISREIPPPTITGRVTGGGAHRTLRYVAHNLPAGARIAFFELGSTNALAPVGPPTTKLHGAISFIPDVMSAHHRTIIAAITRSDGSALTHVTVARYTAAPTKPARVSGLHAHRSRGTLQISFRSASLATSYLVAVRLHDGRRLMFMLGANKRSLVVRGFGATDRVLAVTVRSVRDGLFGPTASLASPGRV